MNLFIFASIALLQSVHGDTTSDTSNSRIVNGDEVNPPHSLEYQVGLIIDVGNHTDFCGGSLISTNTILTAAHCVEGATNVEAILGAHNIQEFEPTQIRQNTVNITIHPEWDSSSLANDLAIVTLPEPVALNGNINVVQLPSRSDEGKSFVGEMAIVSGWGKVTDSGTVSEVLRKIEVPVTSNFLCNWGYLGSVSANHICTSTESILHPESTCNGDSGGPMVLKSRHILIGVTSFGFFLGCQYRWPPVYTRVSAYLDWISATTGITIL